ncbi:DUF4309 domain-containing protein [Bacillus suaedae]|uniref:DUF4309 domain-containing protein n=1 Tax=Halalkalibacter suaedae TaxID=2822140 RepID=A0A940WX20_9BACI|nr:DUF4309 domain-containing protein [Bacillus suaedae]MBP3952202.1 DUF4309 domain-containing protein [Bacillus suaedae]
MKVLKIVYLSCIVLILVACGRASGETDETVPEGQQSLILSQKESFVSFDWIEEGYTGLFVPANSKLGQATASIIDIYGEPDERGSYEGGDFLTYGKKTFFINPDTGKSVAIALDISEHRLTEQDLKRALGTPDHSELNEMDNFWMYLYNLDDFELMFEAETKEAIIKFVWLREK